MSLSIIECVAPVTTEDVGSRILIHLSDEESLVCTVKPSFPLSLMIGFEINYDETSPNLQQKLRSQLEDPDTIAEHLAHVDRFAARMSSEPMMCESFGFTSLDDFQGQLEKHKRRVRDANRIPAYLRGIHGHNIIASDDILFAHIPTMAIKDDLSIGNVMSLDTMI